MPPRTRGKWLIALGSVLALSMASTGCVTTQLHADPYVPDVPRELAKVSLPEYVVEPPDVLLINAVRLVPNPPYRVEPLDVLLIQSLGGTPVTTYRLRTSDQIVVQVKDEEVLEGKPIRAIYPIDAEGKVNLGVDYGKVQVANMTLEEAAAAIKAHLAMRFNVTDVVTALAESQGLATVAGSYVVDVEGRVNLGPLYGTVKVVGKTLEEAEAAVDEALKKTLSGATVTVSLGQSRSLQQIQGEHLVRPDGTIGLGTYGQVHVAGLTLTQVKAALEAHLSQYLQKPELSVDVGFYSSKFYYVITDGGGMGEQVYRFNVTGNETVLDALSQINGLPAVSSKSHVWLARPAPAEVNCEQVLKVDWNAIARGGGTKTNYQVLPGDRIYVMAEPLVTFDTFLARVLSPIERVTGTTLLVNSTIRSFNNNQFGNQGGFP